VKVLVDTSVWSLALRRRGRRPPGLAEELGQLIADARIGMIGPIRQEILSGIREAQQFERLRQRLSAFPDLPLASDDYVTAARYFNLCRARGVQGSNTDFLICAAAVRNRLAIYTTDRDFGRFAKHLPITLHEV
jgi:hypothetical protein